MIPEHLVILTSTPVLVSENDNPDKQKMDIEKLNAYMQSDIVSSFRARNEASADKAKESEKAEVFATQVFQDFVVLKEREDLNLEHFSLGFSAEDYQLLDKYQCDFLLKKMNELRQTKKSINGESNGSAEDNILDQAERAKKLLLYLAIVKNTLSLSLAIEKVCMIDEIQKQFITEHGSELNFEEFFPTDLVMHPNFSLPLLSAVKNKLGTCNQLIALELFRVKTLNLACNKSHALKIDDVADRRFTLKHYLIMLNSALNFQQLLALSGKEVSELFSKLMLEKARTVLKPKEKSEQTFLLWQAKSFTKPKERDSKEHKENKERKEHIEKETKKNTETCSSSSLSTESTILDKTMASTKKAIFIANMDKKIRSVGNDGLDHYIKTDLVQTRIMNKEITEEQATEDFNKLKTDYMIPNEFAIKNNLYCIYFGLSYTESNTLTDNESSSKRLYEFYQEIATKAPKQQAVTKNKLSEQRDSFEKLYQWHEKIAAKVTKQRQASENKLSAEAIQKEDQQIRTKMFSTCIEIINNNGKYVLSHSDERLIFPLDERIELTLEGWLNLEKELEYIGDGNFDKTEFRNYVVFWKFNQKNKGRTLEEVSKDLEIIQKLHKPQQKLILRYGFDLKVVIKISEAEDQWLSYHYLTMLEHHLTPSQIVELNDINITPSRFSEWSELDSLLHTGCPIKEVLSLPKSCKETLEKMEPSNLKKLYERINSLYFISQLTDLQQNTLLSGDPKLFSEAQILHPNFTLDVFKAVTKGLASCQELLELDPYRVKTLLDCSVSRLKPLTVQDVAQKEFTLEQSIILQEMDLPFHEVLRLSIEDCNKIFQGVSLEELRKSTTETVLEGLGLEVSKPKFK